MLTSELIAKLQKLFKESGDVEVMVLDGFNGGGYPRTINLGPKAYQLSEEDAYDSSDCEERVGETVIQMGYGCY